MQKPLNIHHSTNETVIKRNEGKRWHAETGVIILEKERMKLELVTGF